jgi:hypothetical protein
MQTTKEEISRWHSSTWAWFVGLPVGLLILIIAGSVGYARIREYQQELAQQRALEQERQNRLQQEEYARQQRLEQQRREAEEMRLRREREDRERAAKQQQEERERQFQQEEEQRRLRRREQLEDEQRRELERERAESEAAAKRAEEERNKRAQQRQEMEDKRRADLEKRGLAYYLQPTSIYKDKNAQQWYDYYMTRPGDSIVRQRTIQALVSLREEGIPFLIRMLKYFQKKEMPMAADNVIRSLKPELVHFNDVHVLVDCLDDGFCKDFTRMVTLEQLAKRKDMKKHLKRIAWLTQDLLRSDKYGQDAKELIETIGQKE